VFGFNFKSQVELHSDVDRGHPPVRWRNLMTRAVRRAHSFAKTANEWGTRLSIFKDNELCSAPEMSATRL
jgi:hypothetical protein